MPDIRLQGYVEQIKDMIRDGRHDEAIAHCQHILKEHSKYIEVYGLLGEACLEKGVFREAIEFFQRTLSADPENFIARVGLGIIYSEQGGVPEAIWQMERAFELTPGNAEVRGELQRLYAQRDGSEKARLKLTRGALGRLYARNGLYERAIGEFRSVLRQDPDLPDIRVALLEALWREGRRLEAVESALDLLEALPNCLKANLILGEIWTRGGHEDAGEEKLTLAAALDPENQVAQELMGRDSPLPFQEVHISELEFVPELPKVLVPETVETAMAPAWDEGVEDLGEEKRLPAEAAPDGWEAIDEMPDWLSDMGVAEQVEPAQEAEAEVAAKDLAPGEDVPDWLQELMGDGELAAEGAIPLREDELLVEAAAIEEAPDWLRELEVAETDDLLLLDEKSAEVGALPAEEFPEWLQELREPVAGEIAPEPVREVPAADEISPAEWLGEPEVKEIVAPAEAEPPAAGVPASLTALVAAGLLDEADLDSAMAEMTPDELEVQQEEAVPDWLQDLMGEEEAPPAVAEAPIAEKVELEPVAPEIVPAEELPAWLSDLEAPEAEKVEPEPVAPEIAPAEAEPPAAEIPASLTALVAAGLLDEADLDSAMAEMTPEELEVQQEEAVPDWLQDLMGEEEALPAVAEAPIAEKVELEPVAEEIVPAEELPAWLSDLEAPVAEKVEPEPVAPEIAPAEAEPPAAGVPASMAALVAAGLLDETDLESALAEMTPEELEVQQEEAVPDWLQDLMGEDVVPAAEEPVPPPVEEMPVEEMAIATEIRAMEDTAPLEPEEIPVKDEPPPEEAAEPAPVEAVAEAEPERLPEFGVAEADQVVPLAIEEPPVVEEAAVPPVEEPAPVEQMPAWLRDLGVDELEKAPLEEAEPMPISEAPAEDIPDWLRDFEAGEEEKVTLPPTAEMPVEGPPPVEEMAPPVAEALEEEPVPVIPLEMEEMPLSEEEPLVAEPEVEEIEVEPTVAEPPVEEAPIVEELVPEVEPVLVAPFDRVKVEEEPVPPSKADELLELLSAQPRDYKSRLELARIYRDERDWNASLDHYERLVSSRKHLPAVVEELESMAGEQVDQTRLYQLMGDAHMQQDQLDQALEMYRKARETLSKR